MDNAGRQPFTDCLPVLLLKNMTKWLQNARAAHTSRVNFHFGGRAMEKRWETASLFVLGGAGYLGVELAWRGFTHWSMFWAGGLALCLLHALAECPLPLPAAAACGAAGVSALELAAGLLCRRFLRVTVWDYSAEWANLAGLICPRYTVYWFLLCAWVLLALRAVQRATGSPSGRTAKAIEKGESGRSKSTSRVALFSGLR